MFNLVNRFQGVANKLMTVALVVSGLIVAISYIQLYQQDVWNLKSAKVASIKPSANLRVSRLFGASDGKPKENSKLTFDLDADLTSLFNWNTKQVFVYLTAEYDGKTPSSSNRVTYWDKIITSKKDARFHVRQEKGKYSVWDVEKSFRGREANIKLEWNIQPWVGPLIYGEIDTGSTFKFADAKKNTKKERQRRNSRLKSPKKEEVKKPRKQDPSPEPEPEPVKVKEPEVVEKIVSKVSEKIEQVSEKVVSEVSKVSEKIQGTTAEVEVPESVETEEPAEADPVPEAEPIPEVPEPEPIAESDPNSKSDSVPEPEPVPEGEA